MWTALELQFWARAFHWETFTIALTPVHQLHVRCERGFTRIVLYTEEGGWCDKQANVVGRMSTVARPTTIASLSQWAIALVKSTDNITWCDDWRAVAKFSEWRVWDKVPLFLELPKFLVQNKFQEASIWKTGPIHSTVSIQYRPVTDTDKHRRTHDDS